MSPRSVAVLLILLVSAFVVAKWSDLITITYYNVTPVKMCSLDRPDYCVWIIKLNFTTYNPNTTSIFWMYADWRYSPPWKYGGSLPDTSLLQALYYNNVRYDGPLTITVPKKGYLYNPSATFYVDGRAPDAMTVCGKQYNFIAPVSAGTHTLTKFSPGIYFLDPETCLSYLVVGLSWYHVTNITAPWALIYIMHMPTGRKVVSADVINGTRHTYTANIAKSGDLWPIGRGVYIGNGTYLPTIAMAPGYFNGLWYGPVPIENYSKMIWRTSPAVWIYTIGADLSNGLAYIRQPVPLVNDFTYISEDGSAGYVRLDSAYRQMATDRRLAVYMRRDSVVEFAVTDSQGYVYGARTIACLAYAAYEQYGPSPPEVRPFRLDTAKQLELCNNRTDTLYVALYVNNMYYYNYIDRLDPGQCRMVRFDGTRSSSDIIYYFYSNTTALCRLASNRQGALFSVSGLAPWYRYYVLSNNTVKQGPPIDYDADYYSTWMDLAKFLAQMYNSTLNALKQMLQQQAQQQADATQALQGFIASQPHITGTIRVDSSTSTWLKTTLNVLQKWQATGASASFGAVSIPAVPTAVAPAAAAAVAVAWAASRRDDDVATTVAVAGIALALFGILMTLIYGTGSLTLVALGIIAAAAAAAWKKI